MKTPAHLVRPEKKTDDCSLTVDIGYALDLAMRQMREKDAAIELAEARKGLALVPAKKAKRKRAETLKE